MAKSTRDGFGRTNMALEELVLDPNISDDITQTLGRIMGFNYITRQWVGLATDIDGRLVISQSGVQTNQAIAGTVNVLLTATLIRPENPNRRQILLVNNGTTMSYIGFNAGVTALLGFPLPPGSTYEDSLYTGEYWGIAITSFCNFRFMEF